MEKLPLDYIAGLMDADGSISIGVTKNRYKNKSGHKTVQFSFNVNLRQVPQYRYILEAVQFTLGAGKIYESKATSSTSTRMASWQTTSFSDSLLACKILRPFLRIKQPYCDDLIEALELWESTKGVRIGTGYSHPDWVKDKILGISSRMNPSQQKETSRRNKDIRMVLLPADSTQEPSPEMGNGET